MQTEHSTQHHISSQIKESRTHSANKLSLKTRALALILLFTTAGCTAIGLTSNIECVLPISAPKSAMRYEKFRVIIPLIRKERESLFYSKVRAKYSFEGKPVGEGIANFAPPTESPTAIFNSFNYDDSDNEGWHSFHVDVYEDPNPGISRKICSEDFSIELVSKEKAEILRREELRSMSGK